MALPGWEPFIHSFRMRGRDTLVRRAPVIVGVDGSVMAAQAAELGAWEATRRHTSLLLVHAYLEHLPSTHDAIPPRSSRLPTVRSEARALLDDLELRIHSRHRALRIRSTLVAGAGASTLVELSRTAALVVVGARGDGGFAGLHLGSVATPVALYAHASVIVARMADQPPAANAPVVVGVDGSPASEATLAYGFELAAARRAPLTAVHALASPCDDCGSPNRGGGEPAATFTEVRDAFAGTLEGWRSKYLDVVVTELVVVASSPAWALIEAGRDAGLLVVGGRGRSGRLLPGSTTEAVLAHADCSVAVVR